MHITEINHDSVWLLHLKIQTLTKNLLFLDFSTFVYVPSIESAISLGPKSNNFFDI